MSEPNVVYGIHAVRAVLTRHPTRVRGIWLQTGRNDARIGELEGLAQGCGIQIERRSARELEQQSGAKEHQGALALMAGPAVLGEGALDDILDAAGPTPLVLILDGVTDPHNLGACLRTADAAGVCAVVAPRDRAVGLNATVRKVACGAAETVPLIQVVNLSRTMDWLKERGLWLAGTDSEAKSPLYAANLSGPLALVLGAEGAGLRRLTREKCDLLISIPMTGIVESLNVSVAAGIVLFEAVRQRSAR